MRPIGERFPYLCLRFVPVGTNLILPVIEFLRYNDVKRLKEA